MGEKPSINGYYDSGSYVATRFLPASEGVLLGLDGLDAAKSSSGVLHVERHGAIGERYEKAVDDSARFVSVVACGGSREEALDNCKRALELVEVRIGRP